MSHLRVKTTYLEMGDYGSDVVKTLYCHHNLSADCTTFYEEDGSVAGMSFEDWCSGKNKWDAMQKLWSPFENVENRVLKEGVEYYFNATWENK